MTVVVIGGGMAGVACAQELGRHQVEVVLLDRNDYLQIQPLNVVIVGGGPTGVETAGAIAELFAALQNDNTLGDNAGVHLVDHGHTLLNPFSDKSHEYALDRLTEKGVTVSFGVAVAEVGQESVTLSDGTRLPTRTVVWGGGEAAAAISASTGATPGRGGRIDTAADLSVPGFPGVYAVGDVANIPGPDGRALPQLGSVAQQSGRWAARNILAAIDGKAPDRSATTTRASWR